MCKNCILEYKEKSDDEKNVDNLGNMGTIDDDDSDGGWCVVKLCLHVTDVC